jgi:solute:Na+ symporter, SSS family
MKSPQFVDYAVIALYFVLMLGIGFYFLNRLKSTNDYFAGGNKIPWWTSGVSLYMTNFSAWIFSGAAGFVYSTGYFALLYLGLGALSYYIGSQLTAARWRRSRVVSPVEYTNTRYNVTTQQLLSWVIALVFILSGGVQLAAIGRILSAPLGIDVSLIIGGVGLIILIYTFSGGLWAVNITDFVQFVILLSVTIVVVPLSLTLIGGLPELIRNIPPITFDHVYNNVHYDFHYLIGIFLVTTLGVAAGGAQRFYSVRDEKSAKRVGRLAGILFLTFPFIFGIPPLVARVLWPDLSTVEFFSEQFQPKDLVFIAVCMKVLPVGLIGVFFAALLAATMSALSSVYNLVSAIIARDMYRDAFNPKATDQQIFRVGRFATILMGLIVMGLALVFVHSELGIFNIMMAFFTLFNLPTAIPVAFGLLFKWIPRWGAFSSITWGLYIGILTRFLLGWGFGPQIYLVGVVSFSIFVASGYLGTLYKKDRRKLAIISSVFTILLYVLLVTNIQNDGGMFVQIALPVLVLIMGASTILFAKLFALESVEDREQVEKFFKRLYTPVDVAKEVYARGDKETTTFPLVGMNTIIIGVFIFILYMLPIEGTKEPAFIILSLILVIFGTSMYYFGRRSEKKSWAKYQQEIKDRGLEIQKDEYIPEK